MQACWLVLATRACPPVGNEAGMCPGINGFTKYAPIADWLGSVASSGVWLGCSLQRGCVLRSAPTAAWAGEPKEPIDKWQEPHYKGVHGVCKLFRLSDHLTCLQ